MPRFKGGGGTSKGQFRLSSLETVRDGLEICR